MSSVANLSGFSEIDLVVLLQRMAKGDTPEIIARNSHNRLMASMHLHFLLPVPAPEKDFAALTAIRRGKIFYYDSCSINTELKAVSEVDGRLYDRDTQVGAFVRIANRVRVERNIPLVQ